MSYLLDTNIVSELRRIDRAHRGLISWASQHPSDIFHLSVVTLLELERGIFRAERRGQPEAQTLRTWLEREVVPHYAARTLPVTEDVARLAARLGGDQLADQLIAATALVHDLSVVTRNIRHFEPFGVRLLNPFD